MTKSEVKSSLGIEKLSLSANVWSANVKSAHVTKRENLHGAEFSFPSFLSEIDFFRRSAELQRRTLNDDNSFHRHLWMSSTILNDFSDPNLIITIKTPSLDSADGLMPTNDPSIIN